MNLSLKTIVLWLLHYIFLFLGAIRSYTDVFKQVRDARVDRFVVETNKLLIRLDRLVSFDAPMDPGKRKGYHYLYIIFVCDYLIL